MRVTVRPQGSITLYGRRELPLMEIRIVTSATVEKREDTSMVSCAKWNKPERLFHVKIVAGRSFEDTERQLRFQLGHACALLRPDPLRV